MATKFFAATEENVKFDTKFPSWTSPVDPGRPLQTFKSPRISIKPSTVLVGGSRVEICSYDSPISQLAAKFVRRGISPL